MILRVLPKEVSELFVCAICMCMAVSLIGAPAKSARLGDFLRQSAALGAEDEKDGSADSDKAKESDSSKGETNNSSNSKRNKTSSDDPLQYVDRPASFSGNASWYGIPFHGRKTANGEVFNMYKHSAAHLSLPLPSKALVEDPRSGKAVIVRVNDRGPYVKTRVMDLSREAARNLGTLSRGVAFIEVTVLEKPKPKPKKRT